MNVYKEIRNSKTINLQNKESRRRLNKEKIEIITDILTNSDRIVMKILNWSRQQ